VRGDVPINSETLLTDFVNLNIKSAQSFECAHKNKIYIHVFIDVSDHINIYVCLKKEKQERRDGSESSRPVHHSLCRGCLRTRRRQTRA
jgi:hypothetical protein